MKCAACHTKMAKKRGEVELRIRGKLYLAENVFYEKCPSCGERVFPPKVGQMLYDKIKKKEYIEKTIKVPVLESMTQ